MAEELQRRTLEQAHGYHKDRTREFLTLKQRLLDSRDPSKRYHAFHHQSIIGSSLRLMG